MARFLGPWTMIPVLAVGISAPVAAQSLLPKGLLWEARASNGNAPILVWDLATDAVVASFQTTGYNGRGAAIDPVDGNLWTSNVKKGTDYPGDGWIHKYPRLGGAELASIPDPGGLDGPGIGALDFDREEGVLWAAAYRPIGGESVFYKLDPATGRVLKTCSFPFQDSLPGNDTLAVACPADIGGRKVLLTDGGEGGLGTLFAIDTSDCSVVQTYSIPVGVTGIDVDDETGVLIGANHATESLVNLGRAPYGAVVSSLPVGSRMSEDLSLVPAPIPPPRCSAGGPYQGECAGPRTSIRLVGSGSSDGLGLPLSFEWTTTCPGGGFDDRALADPVLTLQSPPPCPVTCEVGLTVRTGCSTVASCTAPVTVRDTTPPQASVVGIDGTCLWPPNHDYDCVTDLVEVVEASDLCDPGPLEVTVTRCQSSQPDDGIGDGNTREDCALLPGGKGFCVRAERAGGRPEGRRYLVELAAADSCGNATSLSVGLYVPHDSSPSLDCRRANAGRSLPDGVGAPKESAGGAGR